MRAGLQVIPTTPKEYPASEGMLQSPFWGEFKHHWGWQPRYFIVHDHERGGEAGRPGEAHGLLVLIRAVSPFGYFAYVPHGPEWMGAHTPDGAADWLSRLGTHLAAHLPTPLLCIRFDLPWYTDMFRDDFGTACAAVPALRRAKVEIQPVSTILIDLTRRDEEIRSAMKTKTRYNIGLAERKGVTTSIVPQEQLPRWYELYQETARRDNIAIHSLEYYRQLMENASSQREPELILLCAEHEGDLLAGLLLAIWGETATYLYGASANIKRNLMASYALQWSAMRLAKERKCRLYDLFGIPPSNDGGHSMQGLYRFKTGFGGKIVHRVGAWDTCCAPIRYRGWRIAEQARIYYYRRWRKRNRHTGGK